jgi:hypothetical protein
MANLERACDETFALRVRLGWREMENATKPKGDKVKRSMTMGLLATASLVLLTAACAQNGFQAVAVTKSASTVASCQSVGEVHASDLTPDYDIQRDLTEAVRSKGGNTLLISADGARSGTAYQCSMPEATAQAKSAPGR